MSNYSPNSTKNNSTEALSELLEPLDPQRFSRNLRYMTFQYLQHQHHDLMPDFNHFIEDLNLLFVFLYKLEGNRHSEEKNI